MRDAQVGIIMGSKSDLEVMKQAGVVLKQFGVPFEITVVSAHRTPQRMMDYAAEAESRGLKIIIAGAGGAAHLPGMVAANTPLPAGIRCFPSPRCPRACQWQPSPLMRRPTPVS